MPNDRRVRCWIPGFGGGREPEAGLMDILVEPGRLPERGTLVVPIGHDGRLGTAAASLDQASGGLVRRAVASGELKHGRVVDLLLPAGLQLDRLLLIVLGRADGVSRLDLEEAGGGLA